MNHRPAAPQEAPPHLFIVRVWWESAELGPAGEWRGSVEHTATHEKRYFREVEALSDFIRRQVGWPAQSLAEVRASSGQHKAGETA